MDCVEACLFHRRHSPLLSRPSPATPAAISEAAAVHYSAEARLRSAVEGYVADPVFCTDNASGSPDTTIPAGGRGVHTQPATDLDRTKQLSLSTCGGSASNLTALGYSATTNAGNTATDSSESSTPLSGASSHQQRALRARAQRLLAEAAHQLPLHHSTSTSRPSLDSRSSSHPHDNEDEEAVAVVALAANAPTHKAVGAVIDHQDAGSVEVAAAAAAAAAAEAPAIPTAVVVRIDDQGDASADSSRDLPPSSHHNSHSHRHARSLPSNKRPRQSAHDLTSPPSAHVDSAAQPPLQAHPTSTATLQNEENAAPLRHPNAAMHIPDLSTFADASASASPRRGNSSLGTTPPPTAGDDVAAGVAEDDPGELKASIRGGGGGNESTRAFSFPRASHSGAASQSQRSATSGSHAHVFDDVRYEDDEEVRRALQQQQQQQQQHHRHLQQHPPLRRHAEPDEWTESREGLGNAFNAISTAPTTAAATAGFSSVDVVIAPGGGATVSCTNSGMTNTATAPDATPVEPAAKRFATGEGEAVLLDALRYGAVAPADEEAAVLRCSAFQQQQQHQHLLQSNVFASESRGGENVADEEVSAAKVAATGISDRGATQSIAAGERHRKASSSVSTSALQPPREGRSGKKSRSGASATASGASSGVLASRRYTNDSITAGIPYDPARFAATAPPQQQPPRTGSSQLRSESQPSCATPPDASTQSQLQDTPAKAGDGKAGKPSAATTARAPIALMETRYAFMALSFMMRLLCKLHKGEPIPASDFHSHCLPPMTVTKYVERLVRYCACSGEALLCAFLLLLKYVFHSGHPVTIYNAHRLLITSIVLGIKLRDDVYYSNVYYARIGGITGREMNKLELLFLEKLEWETQVLEEEYVSLLDLLATIGVDAEPSNAQLAAFAAQHADEVAAYELDDEDDEMFEATAKLFTSGGNGEPHTSSRGSATAAATPAEQQHLKKLRGAYRLHQWHAHVVPWITALERGVFDKKRESAQIAAAAQREEGVRWQQYHREDEEASALRRQRSTSVSAWLSPQSVDKRAATSSAFTTNATAAAAAAAASSTAAWASEPPYQSAWTSHDRAYHASGTGGTGNHNHNAGASLANAIAGATHGQPRYNNFMNFANSVTGGNFTGSGSASTANAAAPTTSGHSSAVVGVGGSSGASGLSGRHAASASAGNSRVSGSGGGGGGGGGAERPVSPSASSALHYYYGAHSGVRHTIGSSGSSTYLYDAAGAVEASGAGRTSSQVRYHTASNAVAASASGSASQAASHERPPRAASATAAVTFDITNRAAVPARAVSALSARAVETEAEPHGAHPTVAGTTTTASPTSATVPGSGINVNAQPYYYVSSRMRKQQQQQQAAQAAVDVTTATSSVTSPTADGVATQDSINSATRHGAVEGVGQPRSPASSFTSPASVNNIARFSTRPSQVSEPDASASQGTASSYATGLEAVVAAMRMTGMYGQSTGIDNNGNSLNVNRTSAIAGGGSGENGCRPSGRSSSSGGSASHTHTFPACPITKSNGDGGVGEPATSAHVPRRSPHAAHPPPVHRRATYTAQHSLGKKRSKPDSYKDY